MAENQTGEELVLKERQRLMKDKNRQLRNWIDKLEAMHTILISQDMTGKSSTGPMCGSIHCFKPVDRLLCTEMAELQDEIEIEFNRLREGQKLIRDLLKERRDKNLVHVSDKLGELFRSAALNFFETYGLNEWGKVYVKRNSLNVVRSSLGVCRCLLGNTLSVRMATANYRVKSLGELTKMRELLDAEASSGESDGNCGWLVRPVLLVVGIDEVNDASCANSTVLHVNAGPANVKDMVGSSICSLLLQLGLLVDHFLYHADIDGSVAKVEFILWLCRFHNILCSLVVWVGSNEGRFLL